MNIRGIISPSVACLTVQYFFSKLYNKRHYFRGKIIEPKMCVLISYKNFIWNISHSKENSTICYTNLYICSCKVPSILVRFLINIEFYLQIFEKSFNIKINKNPSSGGTVHNFARGFVWVWNLVADIEGGTQAEGVWEQGVEESIWT